MKVSPGVLATATAAVFVTLVAVGIGYVVHSGDDRVTGDQRPTRSTAASPTRSVPQSVPQPASPSGTPSAGLPKQKAGPLVTFTAKPSKKPPKKKPRPKPPPPPPVLDFTISSFNVLGASHTSGSGKRPGMAGGRVRASRAADLVRRHGSDVVGFQELQGVQLATLQRQSAMDFWPGFAIRSRDTENSIGWRRDKFTAVEKRVVYIPYFNGRPRAMPLVKLRSNDTGVEAWFANFHNPADTSRYHNQQRFRNRATGVEIRLARQLAASGTPFFITGDMNERAEYFCALAGNAPVVAARGGSHDGGCQANRPRAVDWIFGVKDDNVTFSGYFEDRSHLVDITTDHPVVVSQVRIVGETGVTYDTGN
ncbi:MAG: endonuclease/exonuclease/phosphatase family protein [Nocardioidaceae bacterium]